jgi:hypothetical protein
VVAVVAVVEAVDVVAGGAVKTSFFVVVALVVGARFGSERTVVRCAVEPPSRPALIRSTAIVAAARNAAGAPYRVSS